MSESAWTFLGMWAGLTAVYFLVVRYFVPFVAQVREEEPPHRPRTSVVWLRAVIAAFVVAGLQAVGRSLF